MGAFDGRKLREMVLYVVEQGRGDRSLGAAKLHAILFYADFAAYRQFGHSISGAHYRHRPGGPFADDLPATLESLRASGDLTTRPRGANGPDGGRLISNRRADTSVLADGELAIVDAAIAGLRGLSAKQAGELTRREPGWRLTRDGEPIPYRTAWLSGEPLTDEQITAGREIAERHGLIGSPAL